MYVLRWFFCPILAKIGMHCQTPNTKFYEITPHWSRAVWCRRTDVTSLIVTFYSCFANALIGYVDDDDDDDDDNNNNNDNDDDDNR
jgi:hypothetical protein